MFNNKTSNKNSKQPIKYFGYYWDYILWSDGPISIAVTASLQNFIWSF